MKFSFEQLGFIDEGEVTLGDLTLICGPNNMGKTYISHAIYGLLKMAPYFQAFAIGENVVDHLKTKGFFLMDLAQMENWSIETVSRITSEHFSKQLHRFYSVSELSMEGAKVNLSHEELSLDLTPSELSARKFGKQTVIEFSKPVNSTELIVSLQTADDEILPDDILTRAIDEEFSAILHRALLPVPFVVTSERTGIALFHKNLNVQQEPTMAWNQGSDKAFLFRVNYPKNYPLPVYENIQTIRQYPELAKQQSYIAKDPELSYVIEALNELLGGNFGSNNDLLVYETEQKGRDKVSVPVTVASSSVKSLFLIDLYIKCIAQPKGVLIIDEPELNLHPDNQRKMAGLLARLVNAGIKVVVTTHSDYLIREINNRIMLSGEVEDKDEIMADNGMIEQDVLNQDQVKAYIVKDDRKIHDVEVDKYGIKMDVFDDLIAQANDLSDRIYYGIKD